MKRGFNKFNRFMGNRGGGFQQQKQAPLYTVPNNSQNSPDGNLVTSSSTDLIFVTDIEPGSFVGWRLYFPEKAFKDCHELVRKVKAVQKHFTTYTHWYDFDDIEQSYKIPLKLENLYDDPVLIKEWSDLTNDLTTKSTQTLAIIGLAMHNIIVGRQDQDVRQNYQHKKIYTRPIGFDNRIKMEKLLHSVDELVTVTGTVTRIEAAKPFRKMTCYKCAMCKTEIVVRQKQNSSYQTIPSACHKGCPARSRFEENISSPYTITQIKQMITVKECLYDDDSRKVLNIELIQDLVNSVDVGAIVTVIGVMKRELESQKYLKQHDGKYMKSYLKCFTVENRYKVSPEAEITSTTHSDFLQTMKTEPSPFQVLVNSLCPTIYGRDEVKAGLVLALLSGNDLHKLRRSESHILLVGNPGAGKSELLKFCAEVSQKGMFVCGPTMTAAGLLGAVGKNGTIDAGSLILTDGGACCIDEFDKMASPPHSLLESMEQGVVSIVKCGVAVNMPSRAVIIAAANPISSIYDKTKTIMENVRIKAPLMSRFDLVFALERISRTDDEKFLAHVSNRNLPSASSDSSFFSPSSVLSMALLKFYIGYARENVKPKLSEEAKAELKNFFLELKAINSGTTVQVVTFRQLEAFIRLTLARARADLAEEATREHALEVIKIVKYSMIDLFAPHDRFNPSSAVTSFDPKKPRVENLSTLSKPKQMKAFWEHLENEAEVQKRDQFSTAELKSMAKELGIKDFYEIIDKLNHEGSILKTANGYRVA